MHEILVGRSAETKANNKKITLQPLDAMHSEYISCVYFEREGSRRAGRMDIGFVWLARGLITKLAHNLFAQQQTRLRRAASRVLICGRKRIKQMRNMRAPPPQPHSATYPSAACGRILFAALRVRRVLWVLCHVLH